MSNPGVIRLSGSNGRRGSFRRFEIEDNIGEAIHLHMDATRLDFSVEEFFTFARLVRKGLQSLDPLCGYEVTAFDPGFLHNCGTLLNHVTAITIDDVCLSDLRCIVNRKILEGLTLQRLVPVVRTPPYRYLAGDLRAFGKTTAHGRIPDNGPERLERLKASIQASGYPMENRYVILFGNQNIVRDGQHRCAILARLLGPNARIKVMRFHFGKGNWRFRPVRGNLTALAECFLRKARSRLLERCSKG